MATRGSKPIGDSAWAPLFLRIGLGFYFIVLGAWGVEDFQAFGSTVQNYSGIGGNLLMLYAAVAPYVFVVLGGLLILGMFTVAAALASIAFVVPLLYGAGLFEQPHDVMARRTLYKDARILSICMALLFTGGGIFSVDRFMKADK